jgi:penicillin-binding protein 1A
MPDLTTMEDWEKKLKDIPIINGLLPAVVIDMSQQSITVLSVNGSMVTIPWVGLAWARKQINADYLGAKPSKASDVVKLGDVVRIRETSQGWYLAQAPKAEASFIALNPKNGDILALVGGFDFRQSSFNRVTDAQRQPGSSFKPFIYSAAFNKGFTLATVINDVPIVLANPAAEDGLWRPQNDDHRFYGPTRLHDALMYSRNLVGIRLLSLMGVHYALHYLQNFGFSASQLPSGLSLALGTASVTPLQMTAAYAVFANGGFKVVPYAIDHIVTSLGQVIYQAKPLIVCPKSQCGATPSMATPAASTNTAYAPQVITPQNAFLITSALHDVIQQGTAKLAKSLGRHDLAGKTGTSQNYVDAWFAGYNPNLVAVAWMGFDQPQSLHEYGAQASLPMWMQFMQFALKGSPDREWLAPPGIVSVRIDPQTGKRVSGHDPLAQFEYFMTPYVPGDSNEDEEGNPQNVPNVQNAEDASESPAEGLY